MTETQVEPWLEYERRPLRRGFTHPLQQGHVRDALRSAGLIIGRFARSGAHEQYWWDNQVVVLHAHRYGDDVARAWGDHDPLAQVGLAVPGCPGGMRSEVRDVLLGMGLPQTIDWLLRVRERGDAWGVKTRRFEVRWRSGTLTFVEDESHPSLWRTETQGPGLSWWQMP